MGKGGVRSRGVEHGRNVRGVNKSDKFINVC